MDARTGPAGLAVAVPLFMQIYHHGDIRLKKVFQAPMIWLTCKQANYSIQKESASHIAKKHASKNVHASRQ